MKRFVFCLSFLLLTSSLISQNVDYELLGFLDENDEVVTDLALTSENDLFLRVRLKNNGPDMPAITDTVRFDITCLDTHVSYMTVMGNQLQNVGAGDSGIIETSAPLYTASLMDEYNLTTFPICFEVQIIGAAYDPITVNNRACVQISRPLPVVEQSLNRVRVYPNPTSGICSVSLSNGNTCQVVVYDMLGKLVQQPMMLQNGDFLDLSAQPKGVYFIRVTEEGKVVATEKVIKM